MCTGYIFYHCLDQVPWSLEVELPLKGHLTQAQRSPSDHTRMEDEATIHQHLLYQPGACTLQQQPHMG